MRRALFGVLVGVVLVHAAAGAQSTPLPEDVSTIDGIMRAYYEVVSGPAGESADVERDRTLHHPDAWIAIARTDDAGNSVVNVMTLDEYHGDNAPRQQGFWEWETDRVTRQSGNMVHDGERWWIMD